MKKRILKALRYILPALMVLTIAFTFFQSSLDSEKSSETSNSFVEDVVEPILPADTPVGSFVQSNIRKIAHFIEFAALGAEVAVYVLLFMPRLKLALSSFFVAPLVALCDETIQIFSDRGPSVADVWLDTAGFCSAAAFVYLIGLVVFLVIKKRARGNNA